VSKLWQNFHYFNCSCSAKPKAQVQYFDKFLIVKNNNLPFLHRIPLFSGNHVTDAVTRFEVVENFDITCFLWLPKQLACLPLIPGSRRGRNQGRKELGENSHGKSAEQERDKAGLDTWEIEDTTSLFHWIIGFFLGQIYPADHRFKPAILLSLVKIYKTDRCWTSLSWKETFLLLTFNCSFFVLLCKLMLVI